MIITKLIISKKRCAKEKRKEISAYYGSINKSVMQNKYVFKKLVMSYAAYIPQAEDMHAQHLHLQRGKQKKKQQQKWKALPTSLSAFDRMQP